VTLSSLLSPPDYLATSSLLIKYGREYLNSSEVGEGIRAVMSLNQEEIANSELQILTNHDLIKKVITTVKLENIYPEIAKNPPRNGDPIEVAAMLFEKALTATAVKKSNVIQITFRHKDPLIATRAVNTLVELFKEKHLQVFSDPKSPFVENQLVAYEQKLKASENNLQEFKQKNKVYSIEEQRSLFLRQRSELDSALKSCENSTLELQKRISFLKDQMKTLAESKTRYTGNEREKIIVEARNRLLAMQIEEQELLKKFTENNRLVVNARKQIQLVRDFLRDQEEDIHGRVKTSNVVYQTVEMDLIKAETEQSAQKAKMTALRHQLNQLNRDIQVLDFNEKQIQSLKRDQLINEKNYQTYVNKAEDARISENMDRLKLANISVIQYAAVTPQPGKSKVMKIVLGIILGAITSIGLAYVSEYASQSFSSPEAVERRLGLRVLASISYTEG
jgi:uncharacterized protein involved in exopolysaccharide biosynthesis